MEVFLIKIFRGKHKQPELTVVATAQMSDVYEAEPQCAAVRLCRKEQR